MAKYNKASNPDVNPIFREYSEIYVLLVTQSPNLTYQEVMANPRDILCGWPGP